MLRSGHLKYLAYGHTFPWFSPAIYTPQLFNVSEDPLELRDIAAANPSLVAQLDSQLVALLGTHYEDIDATAKANDQLIFRQYVAMNQTDAQLLAQFKAAYDGWNDTWTQHVKTWIAATPSPIPSAMRLIRGASADSV